MHKKSHNKTVDIGLLVLLALLWGASFTLIEVAIVTIPPATIVFARLICGGALLLLFAYLSGIVFPKNIRWRALLIQGVLQSALPFTLISWGQKHIDSGLAGLLNTTPPLFVFLISLFLLKDRNAGIWQFAGILIGFAGVLVIVGPAAFAGDGNSTMGQLAVTGASFCYAVSALYAKQFKDYHPVVTAAISMSLASLVMLPLSLWFDSPQDISPTKPAIMAVMALGIFSTAVAMVIYFRLIRTLGPLGVTTGSYLRAGISLILGIFFLGENLSSNVLGGLILILCGVALVVGHIKPSIGKTEQ